MIPLGMRSRWLSDRSTITHSSARPEACAAGRGDGAGKGARTGTVLGDDKAAGLPASRHHASTALLTTAPKSGPTSGR